MFWYKRGRRLLLFLSHPRYHPQPFAIFIVGQRLNGAIQNWSVKFFFFLSEGKEIRKNNWQRNIDMVSRNFYLILFLPYEKSYFYDWMELYGGVLINLNWLGMVNWITALMVTDESSRSLEMLKQQLLEWSRAWGHHFLTGFQGQPAIRMLISIHRHTNCCFVDRKGGIRRKRKSRYTLFGRCPACGRFERWLKTGPFPGHSVPIYNW